MRLLAAAVFALASVGLAFDVFGTDRGATIGVEVDGNGKVAAVQPGSPADHAGLRGGDVVRFDQMPLSDRVAMSRPIMGQSVSVIVQRGAHSLTAAVMPVRTPFWNAFNVSAWLLTLLYAGMALLVAMRAAPGRQRAVIVITLSALSFAWSLQSIAYATPSIAAHFAGHIIGDVCIFAFLIAAYLFVLWFPPRVTAATEWLWRLGLPVSVCAALLFVADNGVNSFAHVLPPSVHGWSNAFTLAASVAMITAVVDAVVGSPRALQKPAVVAGSSLVVLALVNVTFALSDMYGYYAAWVPYLSLLQWASGFGMSYAVLRHRLLDLNIAISRAAIFSVVSLALLAIFALLEWTLATLFERTVGSAFDESGRTALAASVALVVGLSAGSIHRVVEHRVNRVFFAKRYKALEDLHRFALETDAMTDASALLELTLATMRRNLDAQFVALYTGTPETGYVTVGTTATDLPLRFDQNEEVVLRLRRWGKPFIVDNNETHPISRAYVTPMVLRGTLYGFAVCGPKADRTSYLPDEKETVAALVHRVGIAYEWLTRALNPVYPQ